MVAAALGLAGSAPAVAIVGIVLWGLSFGGAATQLQTASADVAGDGVDLANAMVTTVWNAAIATGSVTDGLLLGHLGARVLPWAVLALVGIALGIALRSRPHVFRSGVRTFA